MTLANAAGRRKPRLDPAHLPGHSEGVVLLTGGRDGPLSRLAAEDRLLQAHELLGHYLDWYGPGSVNVELQQNLLQGDTDHNRRLVSHRQTAGSLPKAWILVCFGLHPTNEEISTAFGGSPSQSKRTN